MVKIDITRNYYADLGVNHGASRHDIKRRYIKLALRHHPDKNNDKHESTKRFQVIQTAYEILKDDTTRARYDTERFRAGFKPPARPATQKKSTRTPQKASSRPSPGRAKKSTSRNKKTDEPSAQQESPYFHRPPTPPAFATSSERQGQPTKPQSQVVSEVGSHRSHKIPGHGYQPTVSTESDEEDASQARDRINELFKTTNISSSNFPSSPVPPTKPAFVPHENDRSRLILPREKWDGYVEEMNRYITEWGDFQKTMFKLLLCDHEKARKHWSLEFEKHQQCVVQLGEVRECIRTNGVII